MLLLLLLLPHLALLPVPVVQRPQHLLAERVNAGSHRQGHACTHHCCRYLDIYSAPSPPAGSASGLLLTGRLVPGSRRRLASSCRALRHRGPAAAEPGAGAAAAEVAVTTTATISRVRTSPDTACFHHNHS